MSVYESKSTHDNDDDIWDVFADKTPDKENTEKKAATESKILSFAIVHECKRELKTIGKNRSSTSPYVTATTVYDYPELEAVLNNYLKDGWVVNSFNACENAINILLLR